MVIELLLTSLLAPAAFCFRLDANEDASKKEYLVRKQLCISHKASVMM